ncbi:MAG: HlyD family type I secretion periplasmic adaptor subunit [Hyphomicrobiaceae bacterium]
MVAYNDLEFANDVRRALEHRAPRTALVLILAMTIIVASAIGWAWWATLEEVTSGAGRVIPYRQTQVVQTLEGGIAREILVQEGDLVEKDQVLMRIDDTGFASRLGELRQRGWALQTKIARLTAEANGAEKITFNDAILKAVPQAVRSEQETFRARKLKLDGEINVLKQQLRQRELAAIELDTSKKKLESTLEPLDRELELTRQLEARGAVPKIDVLRLQREVASMRGELNIVSSSLPRAQSAIAEARRRIENARSAFVSDIREQLASARSDLAVIEERLKAATDRVTRTSLRAPARGIINKMNVTTLGAIVQPGRDVIEIVPFDDSLLIETRIRPQDVAFIRPKQDASVKLTAYDFLVYGSLEGKVERISADTIADDRGDAFYRVIVKTRKNYLERSGARLPIIPGMIASVDIKTGEKSVLDYLLKPVLRARHEALRER